MASLGRESLVVESQSYTHPQSSSHKQVSGTPTSVAAQGLSTAISGTSDTRPCPVGHHLGFSGSGDLVKSV